MQSHISMSPVLLYALITLPAWRHCKGSVCMAVYLSRGGNHGCLQTAGIFQVCALQLLACCVAGADGLALPLAAGPPKL